MFPLARKDIVHEWLYVHLISLDDIHDITIFKLYMYVINLD